MTASKSVARDGPRLRKISLAEKLGITRPTLDKYLEMEGAPQPDEDKSYDVDAVAKFIEDRAPNTMGKDVSYLNDLKAQKLVLECEKLRDQIARDQGDFISKKEAAATIIPLMAELDALMKQKYELELPSRYQGKDQVECAAMNAEARDAINRRFRQGVAKITEAA